MNTHTKHAYTQPHISMSFGLIYKIMSLLLCLCLVGGGQLWATPASDGLLTLAPDPVIPELQVKSAIVMEASTGTVLLEWQADEQLAPASMSKMMSEYLVLQHIEQGLADWDDPVRIGEHPPLTFWSNSGLKQGDTHTVRTLFQAMAVSSANDATVALAEFVAGSEAAFVQKMNEMAAQLGLNDSYFVNATGLDRADMPAGYRPADSFGETYMTARDTARLAQILIRDFPQILDVTTMPDVQVGDRTLISTNGMLADAQVPVPYPGVDGFKTGFTDSAGSCFTGTAERNGMRLIAVVMGASSNVARFVETAKLFDYGFDHYALYNLEQGSKLTGYVSTPIWYGVQAEVSAKVAQSHAWVGRIATDGKMMEPQISVHWQEPLVAPIRTGQPLGEYRIGPKDGDQERFASGQLVAKASVAEASTSDKLMQVMRLYVLRLMAYLMGVSVPES